MTWAGRVAIHTMASATSSATSGSATPGVHGVGPLLVAAEPGQREPLGAHHPRRDLGDPHRLVDELEAHRLGHDGQAVLGGGVPPTALVCRAAGDGADVDDDPVTAGLERRQQGFGDLQGANHVDLEHLPPVLDGGVLDGLEAVGAAGVVDEDVEPGPHLVGEPRDVGRVGHVAGHRPAADLRRQGLDPVGPAGRADHGEPRGGQQAGGGLADAAAGAGDDGGPGVRGVGGLRHVALPTGRMLAGSMAIHVASACARRRPPAAYRAVPQ